MDGRYPGENSVTRDFIERAKFRDSFVEPTPLFREPTGDSVKHAIIGRAPSLSLEAGRE